MALFPLIELPRLEDGSGTGRKLFREVAWDFRENRPIWRGGEPVYVTGAPAVLVWAWNTIQTEKRMHDIFTWNHGLGIRSELIGKPYTAAIQQSEAVRYVKEALMVNPYITEVTAVEVAFAGAELAVSCRINTVYGEVSVDGCRV